MTHAFATTGTLSGEDPAVPLRDTSVPRKVSFITGGHKPPVNGRTYRLESSEVEDVLTGWLVCIDAVVSRFAFRLRPMRRTPHEHNVVWKMLKTIPDLTAQLTDEDLKALSKSVTCETWVKGSTGRRLIGRDAGEIKYMALSLEWSQFHRTRWNPLPGHTSLVSV